MDKKIYYVAGLPRSGSTLFMNILNQNPEFHGTASSGLIDVLVNARDTFDNNPFFKAMSEDENNARRHGALRALMQGYFAGVSEPVCFDKNRTWPRAFELLSWLYGKENVKMIICVRDMRDILASFEALHRKTEASGSSTTQTRTAPLHSMTSLGRAEFLMGDDQVVGSARAFLLDAITRGWGDNMYCLDYDHLCSEPAKVMDSIYEFLGEQRFEHDFDNVETVTKEDDRIHGFVGLHDIRAKVEPQPPRWPEIYDNTVITHPWWVGFAKTATFWRPQQT